MAKRVELGEDGERFVPALLSGEARGFLRAQPGELRGHRDGRAALRQRFLEPSQAFEHLRVHAASDLQVGVKLDGAGACFKGGVIFPAPVMDVDLHDRQCRQQRVDEVAAAQHVNGLIPTPERRVEHREPHVR